MESIHNQLEAARTELLDLGLRNPLINFRVLSARGAEIVDENPADLFTILITKNKVMQFAPKIAEFDENQGDDEGQPNNPLLEDKFKDQILQTPYDSIELQKRLLTSYYTTQTYIQEQGINVLYLALGMLHWRDPKSVDKERRAPLLLIPVSLSRDYANENFKLSYTGTEYGDNLALRMKLFSEFDINLPIVPESENFHIDDHFSLVEYVIKDFPEWYVDKTAVSLGFFSFSKFLIYNDLDKANWPTTNDPANHPILNSLLGTIGFTDSIPTHNTTHIDKQLPLEQSYQVVDADSSQAIAINDVNSGKNLVIQGPPGTGKSQTITNLIAEAVGNGKTVLFVAEKMAALDVVKRRLDEFHIGDAALELHSYKTTKSNVLQELARTVALGKPKYDGEFTHLDKLVGLQTYLNTYHQAVNKKIGKSEISLAEAYGQALHVQKQLTALTPPMLKPVAMQAWDQSQYKSFASLLADFQRLLAAMGKPNRHPFYRSTCTELSPNATKIIHKLSQEAIQVFDSLIAHVKAFSAHLNIAFPNTLPQFNNQLINAQILLQVPNLYEVDIHADLWQTDGDGIVAALQAGLAIQNQRLAYDKWLIPEAWTQDVIQIRQGLMSGPRRWRMLSGRYRAAKQALTGLCHREVPSQWEEQIGAVDAILTVQRAQPEFQKYEPHFTSLFGIRWQGEDSNWDELIRISQWISATTKDIQNGNYPPELLAYATKGVQRVWLGGVIAEIKEVQGSYEQIVRELLTFLQYEKSEHDFLWLTFHEQDVTLKNFFSGAERFPEIIRYNNLATQIKAASLQEFLQVANEWEHASTHLNALFRFAWLTTLIDKGEITNAIFSDLTSETFKTASETYQELDKLFLEANRHKLATAHWRQLPRYQGWGQMGLLQSEMGKKRNHMPIRQLMQQAGQAIQLIKPVFMMSPLSIAAYLPPDSIAFDLVIFDEASQVRPIEAFGAILRGKQVVVVGDSKQLPPTMFFENINQGEAFESSTDEMDESSELNELAAIEPKNESILDLFTAQNAPKRMLRWHYRSQHESLIAISNRAFYDRQLIIFPSPDRSRQKSGLRFRHNPETTYSRGGSRTNAKEAALVANAVWEHAQNRPELSLGVVTFSTSQQNEIRRQLERLRRADSSCEPFFKENENEPFFIKNLENVQGDERDVIFISVGYGRSADGTMTMNFGPLNQLGGERRLNVLITRSRQRCELFCNFTADDINLSRTKSVGVAVLKDYLHYAQTGQLPVADYDDAAQPTAFENFVAATLAAEGFTVAQKVGAGQMRLDIGVADKENHNFYTAGVNSDRATNYLTFSCRDRERIQKEVLSRLGWKTINILSHAWWHNFNEEKRQLIHRIEARPQPEKQHTLTTNDIPPFERYTALEKFDLPRPIPQYNMVILEVNEAYKNLFVRYEDNESDIVWMIRGLNQTDKRINFILNKLRKADTKYHQYDSSNWDFINQYLFDHGLEGILIQLPVKNKNHRILQKRHEKTLNNRKEVLQLVKTIVDIESPVHMTGILRRLSSAAGYKTQSNRVFLMGRRLRRDMIQARIACEIGNDFWTSGKEEKILVKDRRGLPKGSKKFEFIADAEIVEAVIIVVHDAVGINWQDVHLRVAQLFGFRQIGKLSRVRIDSSINHLLAEDILVNNGEFLSLNRENFDRTYLLEEPYHSNL